MRYLKYVALLSGLLFFAVSAPAQVAIGVQVGSGYYDYDDLGPPPACPYGYYSYYPYACAPYGYYGPSYFVGGVFIGAGPWYHYDHGYYGRGYYGPRYYGRGYYGDHDRGYRGYDRHYDRDRGYYGRDRGYGNHGNYGRSERFPRRTRQRFPRRSRR